MPNSRKESLMPHFMGEIGLYAETLLGAAKAQLEQHGGDVEAAQAEVDRLVAEIEALLSGKSFALVITAARTALLQAVVEFKEAAEDDEPETQAIEPAEPELAKEWVN
jgi:hypothetical protein